MVWVTSPSDSRVTQITDYMITGGRICENCLQSAWFSLVDTQIAWVEAQLAVGGGSVLGGWGPSILWVEAKSAWLGWTAVTVHTAWFPTRFSGLPREVKWRKYLFYGILWVSTSRIACNAQE